ncbi:MAG: acyl carrier protein [Lachnospiraceae bacterium]|nr:acyl carrier protein [Lachnospiraceae bacterium]
MQREEIAAKVRELIRTHQPGFEDVDIQEDTRINTEAGFDSLTFVYIMCKIEAELGISIPHRRWEKMLTFGDVLDAIEKELAKKK